MNVLYKIIGRTVLITINRPERRNAVDSKTAIELFEAFKRFDADNELAVAVLTGADGAFCAGADLQALADGDERAHFDEDATPDSLGPMGPTRMRLSKPVIAAIEGPAVAGGLEMACWADMRIAAESAVFGVFCRRFGVPLVDLGTVRLPRLIGQSRAADMILTGREVDADEALSFGLANRVVENGTAVNVALEIAEQIASFPQRCMRNDRLSMLQQWAMSDGEAMANEFRLGLETIESGETLAGASAFKGGKGRHGSFE